MNPSELKLVFTLPGNWTSPWILLRLLEVVESPWTATEQGFENPETGERVRLAMAAAVPEVARVFADSTDPTRPPMEDELVGQIAEHKAIVQVIASHDPEAPLASLRTALRATNAVVDGGALAVQCGNSGLVHGADAFQGLMKEVEAAPDDEALAAAGLALVVRYVLGSTPMTLGAHALGRPDAMLAEPTSPDRAVGHLERLVLRGEGEPVDDPRELPEIVRNPYGVLTG